MVTKCCLCGCRAKLPTSGRNWTRRRYATISCRNRVTNRRWREYHNDWQRRRWRQRTAEKWPDSLVKCLDCGEKFAQLGTHVIAKHGYLSARDYREAHQLELKRGLTKGGYRRLKSKQVKITGNICNLEAGARYRFVTGDGRPQLANANRSRPVVMRVIAKVQAARKRKRLTSA